MQQFKILADISIFIDTGDYRLDDLIRDIPYLKPLHMVCFFLTQKGVISKKSIA
jgi:hypothetical protein